MEPYGRHESYMFSRSRPSSRRENGPPTLLKVKPQPSKRGSALRSRYAVERDEQLFTIKQDLKNAEYQAQQRKEAEKRVRKRIANETFRERARQERARQEREREERASQETARQERERQERARQERERQERARQERARQEQSRRQQRQPRISADERDALIILGLDPEVLPSKTILNKTYRELMRMGAHPNKGGDTDKAQIITAAKQFLDKKI